MIVVLDYGMGNIHSIVKALKLFYPEVIFTQDTSKIKNSRALVLPGDGHFQTAMMNLKGRLEELIYEHLQNNKPILGICIGFQILFEDSNESFDSEKGIVRGLGIVPGQIRKFSISTKNAKQYRIPHMGWNRLIPDKNLESNIPSYWQHYMYFIHSYRAQNVPGEYVMTWTQFADEIFPTTVKKGCVMGCQYHPEKSDRAGLDFLKDWIHHYVQ